MEEGYLVYFVEDSFGIILSLNGVFSYFPRNKWY